MSKLNLESFNEILFESIEGKIKMIEAELDMICGIMMDKVAELLDELTENGYKSELFSQITNIKNNTESLIEELEFLNGKREEGDSDDLIDGREVEEC